MVSVGVVVDLCGAVAGQIQPYCDDIMGALTDCLRDSTAHRETKPPVFSCFGDIAMAIGAAFEPYLQVATMLLMQAAQAQIQPDDEDLVDFINRLRLSILDAYTGIIMGLSDGQALHLFAPNVEPFSDFCSTCRPRSPTRTTCACRRLWLWSVTLRSIWDKTNRFVSKSTSRLFRSWSSRRALAPNNRHAKLPSGQPGRFRK